LIAITIGMFQNAFSQFAFNNVSLKLKNPPNNSYKIIQTRKGEITKIEEVNENGNGIFQYIQVDIPTFFNWNEPHRFIYAFEFNNRGDKTKRYAFNSNAGHNIYEYEYDLENREMFKKIISSSGEVKIEINTKYLDDKTKITAIMNYRNGQKTSTYKHAEVKDSLNNTEIKYSVSGKNWMCNFISMIMDI